MIAGAVPSGAIVPSGAVGSVAPRCCEGRKEKVLAGVRGWTVSSMVGWRNGGLCVDILFIPGMLVLSCVPHLWYFLEDTKISNAAVQLWLSCWNTESAASPSFCGRGDPQVLGQQLQPKGDAVGVCWVLVSAGLDGTSCARPQELLWAVLFVCYQHVKL